MGDSTGFTMACLAMGLGSPPCDLRGGHGRLVPSLVINPGKNSVKGVPAPPPTASAHKQVRRSLQSQGRVLRATLKKPIP